MPLLCPVEVLHIYEYSLICVYIASIYMIQQSGAADVISRPKVANEETE